MSKQNSTEDKLDFDISSIFGEFKPEGLTNPDGDPDIVKDLPEDVKEEIENKDIKTELEEDVEEEEEEKEIEEDVPNEIVEEEEPTDEDQEVEYSYKALASYLAEQGVIDFEDSEDIEDNPEILEEAVFNTAKNMVEEYKQSIPEEGKKFLDYLEQGGDPSKYLESLQKPLDFSNIDLDDEDTQKRVIKEYLKSLDYSPEEIDSEVKDYEDALMLGKKAKVASKKLEAIHNKKQEELLKQQEAANLNRQKEAEKHIESIKNTIDSTDTLGGLKITKAEKKSFEHYLLQRDKSGMTQYEKELQENPLKTQLELAYLKFKKYDFSKVANKVKTEETRRIKNLVKVKDTTVKGKSVKVNTSPSDMSAFKGFLK